MWYNVIMTTTETTPTRYVKFARIAHELAETNRNTMIHSVAAIILNKNKIVSIGYNSRKTSPMMVGTRMSMFHAECDALSRCVVNTRGLDIVVARNRRSGPPGMAKPCEHCHAMLKKAGIRKVIYTVNSNDANTPEVKCYEL